MLRLRYQEPRRKGKQLALCLKSRTNKLKDFAHVVAASREPTLATGFARIRAAAGIGTGKQQGLPLNSRTTELKGFAHVVSVGKPLM